ncbi:TetR/AcrR family transcriptional regulator [Paenibacillus allorhizosphaerae]|uniref:HTH-type transcriptional regulator BetI n=1 Tax=Paenibacillus allorhizosphaerae TaxID=2849866 RepID=A0ABM8VIF2_9BACL|nr:TetR/AcrR family transcriptional regulator [Paenibacillus allorhizosphaerae]CAG7644147.1 HTH-type transcriptional regulator BetI [Paenibacillus allorhizosphaerae]
MNDKKMQLIHAGMRLFGERDYHTASVQDIVSLAGVSKGAFYQHFQSKEEMLVSIYRHYFERFHADLHEAQFNQSRTPRELLIIAIQLQCKLVFEDKAFLCMIVKGIAFSHNQVLSDLFLQESVRSLKWFQDRITELYGPDIAPNSLDCAGMLNGLLKEYFFFAIFHNHPIDSTKLSEYLVERLDDLVQGILQKQTKPVLQSSYLHHEPTNLSDPYTLETSINRLRNWITTRVDDKQCSRALLQTLEALSAEMGKEQANGIIIQGMYNYFITLAKENKPLIEQFEQLFRSKVQHTQ